MKRLIYQSLEEWCHSPLRKPLILRGARQVGKTHVVRQFAEQFDNIVEINFETNIPAQAIFSKDLDVIRIIRELSLVTGKKIQPGKTLLFLDEVQMVHQAITALRYFYEELPDLHVIAAGSLLDFAIEEVGVPVGRVQFLWIRPMSFIEFLWALKQTQLAEEIQQHSLDLPMPEVIHQKLLDLLGEYMLVGGMPAVVKAWIKTKDIDQCLSEQASIIEGYRQDFQKYAKKNQQKYLNLLFDRIPLQLSEVFKYSKITDTYRKRELAPSLELLIKAGLLIPVYSTSANGIPLGAEVDFEKFKLIFLDIGLSQTILGLRGGDWLLNALNNFINKGPLAEAMIGQELLAYTDNKHQQHLYYWQRDIRGSQAEIDYITLQGQKIIPIEVKSGHGNTLKSLHSFIEAKKSEYGIRFSTHNYSSFEKIHSYPLYAVARLFLNFNR